MNVTGKVGADGTGGVDTDPRTKRTYAGAAVIGPSGSNTVYMDGNVSGRETVPRAELTALMNTLGCMSTCRRWVIFIDAPYVINGVEAEDISY